MGLKSSLLAWKKHDNVRSALSSFSLTSDAECRLYEELLCSALPSPACRAELLQVPQPRSWKAGYCMFQHNEHIPLTFFYHLVMNESMLHRAENWIQRLHSAPCRNLPLTWNQRGNKDETTLYKTAGTQRRKELPGHPVFSQQASVNLFIGFAF